MIRHKSIGLLMILLFVVAGMAQNPSTATVYAVGTCKPTLPSFSTINAALAANPAPSVVQVCPGTYSEQVVITQGVTLQGLSIAGLGQAIVQAPSGGLSALATNGSLQPVAPMLWANSAAGPVTVNDITFDGNTAGSISAIIAGIFLQNSAATINRVAVRNLQVTGPFADIGIYIEGGASSPVITVQNSSIHDIRSIGIYTETPSGGGSLSTTLKGNYVSAKNSGIFLDSGSAGTVTGNNISGGNTGISTNIDATEAISGNTIIGSGFSIAASDGSSVNGNKIFGSLSVGVLINGNSVTVQNNAITGGPVGIGYECFNDANVNSNVLNEVATGLNNVPNGLAGANAYFNVGTIRSIGVCGP